MRHSPAEAQYLLRFDDLCPTMDQARWARFAALVARFKVQPILAVVPDNRDPELERDSPDEGFWEQMRALEDSGAAIGLHGYRHVLRPPVLDRFPRRAVNLHISYLPWNRGADPNLWSFIDNTPKGVSIHYLDAGIDTGDLIAQKAVEFGAGETLRTSYVRLQNEIAQLLAVHWGRIRDGSCDAVHQVGTGSFHRTSDREKIAHLLSLGWDTPVAQVEQAGAEWRGSQGPA